MELGEPGYDELWAFADLRSHQYLSARVTKDDHEEVWVCGLVIAYQRGDDGGRDGFLLVELDEAARVIDDWVETELDVAKEHGGTMAEATLMWEPIPDTDDVRGYIRRRMCQPRPS